MKLNEYFENESVYIYKDCSCIESYMVLIHRRNVRNKIIYWIVVRVSETNCDIDNGYLLKIYEQTN